LAYVIDSTAAPICIIAPVSSWAAAVGSSLPEGSFIDGFALFLQTIPFNLYAIFTMLFMGFIIVSGRDFATMKKVVADNNKTIVTHRIVAIETDEKDSSVLRFKTQGDANASADAKLVHYKNVLGTPIVTIPYLGYIAHGVQQPPGIYIALVVGTLLLAWTFLPGTLEERRKTARNNVA